MAVRTARRSDPIVIGSFAHASRRRGRELVRTGVLLVGAAALVVWTFLPLYWLVSVSIVDRATLLSIPGPLYPHGPHLGQYAYLLQVYPLPEGGGLLASAGYNELALTGWLNSIVLALAVVPVTMAIALPAAYAFGRLRFRFRLALLAGLVLTRAYPPISVLIPFAYVFMKLDLDRSLYGVAIAHLSLTIPLITWIMAGFFASIPPNLERAARVDGLSRFGALVRVLIPIARPGLAACAVIAFLTTWNEFFFALILTNGSGAQTAPLNVATSGPAYVVMSTLPAIVLTLLVQRSIRALNIVNPL
jgi:multiple sugar transport system permease protein